jgi:MFS family permease
MSVYSLAAVGGTGLGPVAAGWVEMNSRLRWRWIQWIHMMFVVLFTAINLLLMRPQSDSCYFDLGCHYHERDSFYNYFNTVGQEGTRRNG